MNWQGNCHNIQNFKGEKLENSSNFSIYDMEIFFDKAFEFKISLAKSKARGKLLNAVKKKCRRIPSDLKFIIQCESESLHLKKYSVVAVTRECKGKYKSNKLEK